MCLSDNFKKQNPRLIEIFDVGGKFRDWLCEKNVFARI